MKFEFKSTKVPSRARKRLPDDVTDPRAYKVRLKPGPGYDGGVIGMVVGSDLAGKPGWSTFDNGVLSGGFGTRQAAAESMV
jgi:hypothetical protein